MPKDILLNSLFDLAIKAGDFDLGESTYQHQQLLILSDKGEWKENPKRGVGTKRFLESERPDNLAREIRQEFIADGMEVDKIRIGENLQISVEANYNQS